MKNIDTCTCPSGDGSLRHPCPSHPTIADVQPAGRMILGDWRIDTSAGHPILVCKDGSAIEDDDARYVLSLIQNDADLSAQPSPGGQGDDDVLADIARKVIELIGSARPHHRKAVENALYQVLPALRDSLAARQPVGEPVAYLDLGAGGYMDVGTDLSDEELAALPKGRHMLGIIGTYGVDGYKPAQAVDLGQFREAVLCWRREQWSRTTYVPDAESSPGDNVERADRLLALIDGHGARNG